MFLAYPAISAYVSNYADADKQGLVQGIITGIRGLCNGLGPCAFGLVFNLFNVDLNNDNAQNISPASSVHQFSYYLNQSFSEHIYGLLNTTNLFAHHFTQNDKVVPGPPFLFGALLVLLAILVMAFIPELIQYPPNGAHYVEHSAFSSSGPVSSSKNRAVMSPSRLLPRSNASNNYYYKSMHLPSELNDDTDCSQPSDNVKMISVNGNNLSHKHISQRKALLAVETSTLYLSSTSCMISCSESDDKEESETEASSSDEDFAFFNPTKQSNQFTQTSVATVTGNTATIGDIPIESKSLSSNQLQQAVNAFNSSKMLARDYSFTNTTRPLSKLPHYHTQQHKQQHYHHSHQLLPMTTTTTMASKAAFSSVPTLGMSNITNITNEQLQQQDINFDRDNKSHYQHHHNHNNNNNHHQHHHHNETQSLNHRSLVYKSLLQTVET